MRFISPTATAIVVAAVVLTGCAQSGGQYGAGKYPAPEAGIPGFTLASRTVASGEFVEVEVSHRSLNHRVEQVALVGPDGRRTISRDVRTERVRVVPARPGGHLGVSGGSGGVGLFTGIGITFPIGGLFRNPTYRTRALVRVPDPAGYRAAPGSWRVAVVMGQRNGAPRTIEKPAPEVR